MKEAVGRIFGRQEELEVASKLGAGSSSAGDSN